jgi:hypothetical protein
MLMEDVLLNVGPKLLKSIGRQESAKAFRSAQQHVLRIGFAVKPPGVGEEVIPENRRV